MCHGKNVARPLFLQIGVPSGKHIKNYGKSPFFMGKSTISTGPFSIAFCMFTRPGNHQSIGISMPHGFPLDRWCDVSAILESNTYRNIILYTITGTYAL